MPNTPYYNQNIPTVGADADTWGTENNDAHIKWDDVLASPTNTIKGRITAGTGPHENLTPAQVRTQLAVLPLAGGTMTGPVAGGDPTPNGAGDLGFRGLPTISIDADRTFLVTDAGKCIRLTGTTARTWTIPSGVLQVNQVIVLRNFGTQPISLVRAGGVALRIPGSATDANRTVSSQAQVTLYQEDTNIWTVSGTGVA